METINRLLNGVADVVMWPWSGVSPWPGLVVVSLLTAVLLVAIFRVTSNQDEIRRSRNRFLARALELLLFQHELRVSLTACGRIFAANLKYLGHFLVPIAIATVPLLLIFVQLESWFDRRPLKVGESAVIVVELDRSQPVASTSATISAPHMVRVDSPGVRIPARNEIAWRVVASDSGVGWVDVTIDGRSERKSLVTGTELIRTSVRRERRGFISQWLNPSESPLPTVGPIRRIEVWYPPREICIGYSKTPWPVAAVLLMIVFGLVVGRLAGVRIA